jgi:methionyl aminopeptidase
VIIRKSNHEIEKMAEAGRIVAETIAHVGERIEPGITTGELDGIAEDFIRAAGGTPTSLGYRGYPAAICISPNDVVVHGIPGAYVVGEGDLVTIDVGVTLDGFIADSA